MSEIEIGFNLTFSYFMVNSFYKMNKNRYCLKSRKIGLFFFFINISICMLVQRSYLMLLTCSTYVEKLIVQVYSTILLEYLKIVENQCKEKRCIKI